MLKWQNLWTKRAFVRVDEVLVYYTAETIKQQNSEKTVENRIFKRWLLKFVIDWVVYVFLCTNDKLWYRAFSLAWLANLLEQEKGSTSTRLVWKQTWLPFDCFGTPTWRIALVFCKGILYPGKKLKSSAKNFPEHFPADRRLAWCSQMIKTFTRCLRFGRALLSG